jgi:hypothetical protein
MEYCEEDNHLAEVNLDWQAAKEIISKCWLETFEKWINNKKIKVRFKDVYSPREYNFGGDECNFDLIIPKAEMNKIISFCFDEREGFSEYLVKFHSSYDGYWSYISNNINDHMEAWSLFKARGFLEEKNVKHLLWVCLDYHLFAHCEEEFERDLWDVVLDAEGNGKFYEVMEYRSKEVVEVV